jgi:hypothetical protein
LQDLLDEHNRLTALHRTRAGRNAQARPKLRPYFRQGQNLYRITVPSPAGPQHLNIGMTSGSIAARTIKHYLSGGDSRGEIDLHNHMRGADPRQIRVQPGNLPANMPARRAHGYEIWLQDRERVSDWPLIQDTRTFESARLAESDAFADLRAAD